MATLEGHHTCTDREAGFLDQRNCRAPTNAMNTTNPTSALILCDLSTISDSAVQVFQQVG